MKCDAMWLSGRETSSATAPPAATARDRRTLRSQSPATSTISPKAAALSSRPASSGSMPGSPMKAVSMGKNGGHSSRGVPRCVTSPSPASRFSAAPR